MMRIQGKQKQTSRHLRKGSQKNLPSKLLERRQQKHQLMMLNKSGETIQQNNQSQEESPKKNQAKRNNSVDIMGEKLVIRLNKIRDVSMMSEGKEIRNERASFEKLQIQKKGFSEMYRDNLRRTVFNETKKMVRDKKRNGQFRIQSQNSSGHFGRDSPGLIGSISKQINATICHENVTDSQPKKIDSLYRTIVQISTYFPKSPSKNSELGIAKFPIIKRDKKPVQILEKMVDSLNNQTYNPLKERMSRRAHKSRFLQEDKRVPSRQQLRPWETFVDLYDY